MDEMSYNGRVYIHGIGIDRLTQEGARLRIASMLDRDQIYPQAVFTPNAEIIYRSAQSPHLCSVLNAADMSVADGTGTVWAAKKLGTPLYERVTGIDLGEYALGYAAEKGLRVFMLGGRTAGPSVMSVSERAALKLREKYPHLIIAGTHHGYFDTAGKENERIVKCISESGTALLIVCLGFPKQEEWILENREKLKGVRVAMALGGSLDVWSGECRRAPAAIRAAHLEWLWRTALDPRRMHRVMALPKFVTITLKEAKAARLSVRTARK